ncbi:hypothetical protein AcW1_009872 [Taiwanofungus camphoratus]|nr:hypothetical protein AcW1_009872 [Antrodia cinnamomea]
MGPPTLPLPWARDVQASVPTAPSPLLIQRWCVKEAPHPRPGGPSRTARHTYYASVLPSGAIARRAPGRPA